jgi:hypothetical protein
MLREFISFPTLYHCLIATQTDGLHVQTLVRNARACIILREDGGGVSTFNVDARARYPYLCANSLHRELYLIVAGFQRLQFRSTPRAARAIALNIEF